MEEEHGVKLIIAHQVMWEVVDVVKNMEADD